MFLALCVSALMYFYHVVYGQCQLMLLSIQLNMKI